MLKIDWREHWSRFSSLFQKETLFWQSGLAFTVGVVSGYANVAFRYVLNFFHWLFWDVAGGFIGVGHEAPFHRIYLIWLIPVLGAILLVCLSKKFKGEILGYGFPTFLELVNVRGAKLRKRWVALKTLAASISIGSGGSAGLEGPTAQVGGAVGFAVGQFIKVPTAQLKVWVAAGSAGAIAAIFNAPIAGVLFAQEIILLGDFTLNTLTLTVISAGVATVVSRSYFGAEPLFSIPLYASTNAWGLPLYAVMGIVIGILAAVYIMIFHGTRKYFDRLDHVWSFKLTESRKPVLGAFFIGFMAMFAPQILGEGHRTISAGLSGSVDFKVALALVFLKMIANSVSLGTGGAGGIFGPCLFIGTMIGTAFGAVAVSVFPDSIADSQGLYALVGMGAFLAATTHAPLTAIFLIFEITDNHHVVLPTFFCTFIATTMARAIIPSSIDSLELEEKGINIHAGFELHRMNSVMVRDVMRTQVTTVREETTLDALVHLIDTTDQVCFPVVDAKNNYVAVVSMTDIRQVIFDAEIWKLVVVQELEIPNIKPIYSDENMTDAIRKFHKSGLEELAVVDRENGNKLVGLLRHADIINAYHKEVLLAGATGN